MSDFCAKMIGGEETMTEQQAIDFVSNYQPTENQMSGYICDSAYNARRCGKMAKLEYGLSEADAHAIRMLYIFQELKKRRDNELPSR